MTSADLVHHGTQALYLCLLLSLPAIVVASVVGTLFAILQALTQIQEQTLSYAVKLIATVAALALTWRWMGSELYQYTDALFSLIPVVGK